MALRPSNLSKAVIGVTTLLLASCADAHPAELNEKLVEVYFQKPSAQPVSPLKITIDHFEADRDPAIQSEYFVDDISGDSLKKIFRNFMLQAYTDLEYRFNLPSERFSTAVTTGKFKGLTTVDGIERVLREGKDYNSNIPQLKSGAAVVLLTTDVSSYRVALDYVKEFDESGSGAMDFSPITDRCEFFRYSDPKVARDLVGMVMFDEGRRVDLADPDDFKCFAQFFARSMGLDISTQTVAQLVGLDESAPLELGVCLLVDIRERATNRDYTIYPDNGCPVAPDLTAVALAYRELGWRHDSASIQDRREAMLDVCRDLVREELDPAEICDF